MKLMLKKIISKIKLKQNGPGPGDYDLSNKFKKKRKYITKTIVIEKPENNIKDEKEKYDPRIIFDSEEKISFYLFYNNLQKQKILNRKKKIWE